MEIFVKGNYMWVPFTRIKSIKFDPPADLRDQVWMPAQFMWTNDGEAHGFVPTRYPGSTAASDPQLMTSRRTDWHDISPDWALPLGQRILVTDGEETALMDIRTLTIAPADAGAA